MLLVFWVLISMIPSPASAVLTSNRLLKKITLPPGFKIEIYAEKVTNARSMTLSPSGILFVGTRKKGDVYAVIDQDKDQKADEMVTIASGLNMPNGVAFRDGHSAL
jgi:glucose/arabinose dehydrogenase